MLMSAPMVRALLDGSKTQTRRPVKGRALEWLRPEGFTPEFAAAPENGLCPYGKPGERLWLREAWRAPLAHELTPPRDIPAKTPIVYQADGYGSLPHFNAGKLRPSMFMPRWASRITLEITGVRVERLQEISEADALAEGCEALPFPGPWWQGYKADEDGELHHQQTVGETPPDWMIEPKRMKMTHLDRSARDAYRQLWMQINGVESWEANPWVWVVEFRCVEGGAP
jgi:hypothetical protein